MSDDQGPSDNPPSGDFVAALRSFGMRAAHAYNDARPRLHRLSATVSRQLSSYTTWMAEHGPQIAAAAVALKRLSAESHIENWAALEDEEDWRKALQLMCADDGVPLAWTPPADIVKLLVDAADHAARDAVLLAHAKEIEAHARALLDVVTRPELDPMDGARPSGSDVKVGTRA